MRCFFHKFVSVVDIDHTVCGPCFRGPETLDNILLYCHPRGLCPHFVMVCKLCGKLISSDKTGETDRIPEHCKMRKDDKNN